MRPIDADALREHWHISGKCEECHWNNRDCSKPPYYSLHDICEAIDEVPTIPAIPVEWLNQKYAENEPGGDRDYDYFLWDAIAYILTEWQKEQEAK